jgi:hypothetical protein
VRGAIAAALRWLAERPGVALLSLAWVLVVANFIPFHIRGDGERPYTFLRALFGDTKTKDAYQFGLALFEAPFYAIGKLVALGASGTHAHTIEEGVVVVGLAALVLAAVLALVPVLEGLGLPAPGLALGAGLFGTPLFYYGALHPGDTHATDAVLFVVLVVLIFAYFRRVRPSAWLPAAMGTTVGVAFTVRYFNGALGIGLALGLLFYRRWRDTLLMVGTACVSAGVLCLVAWAEAGNPLAGAAPLAPSNIPSAPSKPIGPGFWPVVAAAFDKLAWKPENPIKMLFSTTHGLFLWTPITVLALIGFVRLLVRDRAHRPFLAVTGACGLAAVLSYAFSPYWTGAAGFSDRYFTILFPIVPIGIASLLQWRRGLAAAAACVATAWSLWLAADVSYGWGYRGDVSTAFDSTARAARGTLPISSLARRIYCASKLRHAFPEWKSCPPPHGATFVFLDPGPAWVAPHS